MVLTKDTIDRNRSIPPRKVYAAPTYILTPSDLSVQSVSSATISTSCDRISNPGEVEVIGPDNRLELTVSFF
ncbi:unnamed protein product [Hymenolepis diminuta]|uniref:Uncharacterized protein n=1 Tax=Hymenolepis diminuta TaxID=6216 RepID=A0A564XUI2_HYMDI|nr:unnamed protein product [Hymenolepis diminuta]